MGSERSMWSLAPELKLEPDEVMRPRYARAARVLSRVADGVWLGEVLGVKVADTVADGVVSVTQGNRN